MSVGRGRGKITLKTGILLMIPLEILFVLLLFSDFSFATKKVSPLLVCLKNKLGWTKRNYLVSSCAIQISGPLQYSDRESLFFQLLLYFLF